MTMLPLSFLIGLVFGFLAGLIAFLITYGEWQKHKFTGWQLWREALLSGSFTFVFFLASSIIIGYLVIKG